MSLLAKSDNVTLDAVTNCASFIMTFSDFSYLMCLLNTTELAIDSWEEVNQCSAVRLDDSNLLMLVNMTHSCTEGYIYASADQFAEHRCVPKLGRYSDLIFSWLQIWHFIQK